MFPKPSWHWAIPGQQTPHVSFMHMQQNFHITITYYLSQRESPTDFVDVYKSCRKNVWQLICCNIRGEPPAPSAAEFESVLRDVCRGVAAGKVCAGQGCRKFSQIVLCLADASKEIQQDFVKKSISLVLMRDARAGKVALRFAAVDAKMRVHCGLVGWMAFASSTGMSIRDITDECFKRFSTLRLESTEAQKLKTIRRDLKFKAHTIVTDAAANEVLASEIALGDQQPGGQAAQNRIFCSSLSPLSPRHPDIRGGWAALLAARHKH